MGDDVREAKKGMGLGVKLAIGALAVLGAISMVSWILSWFFGVIRFGLFAVVVVGIVLVVAKFAKGPPDIEG